MLLITGGAGFIGGNFVRYWCNQSNEQLIIIDKLTYAGNLLTIESAIKTSQVKFIQGDICDQDLLDQLFDTYQPRALIHFAAESHVDRSICNPNEFIQTNICGTFNLLEAARRYLKTLPQESKEQFKFMHVSTDEVYGSLNDTELAFTEMTPYAPNSPYSASKAGSDHLVRAYHYTYDIPTIITNCSNNYGPYQSLEKLIPLMILNAIEDKPLPLYGDGKNIRDWLFVIDHCVALCELLNKGKPGEHYNIGGNQAVSNLSLVTQICEVLDCLRPKKRGRYKDQIIFVEDRPGHDKRYEVNIDKIQCDMQWSPKENIETGLLTTIQWYLNNSDWLNSSNNNHYKEWVNQNYSNRDTIFS